MTGGKQTDSLMRPPFEKLSEYPSILECAKSVEIWNNKLRGVHGQNTLIRLKNSMHYYRHEVYTP